MVLEYPCWVQRFSPPLVEEYCHANKTCADLSSLPSRGFIGSTADGKLACNGQRFGCRPCNLAVRYQRLSVFDPHGRGEYVADRIVCRDLLCVRQTERTYAMELQHSPRRKPDQLP